MSTRMNAYEELLEEICVGKGFCGSSLDGQPTHVDFHIPKSGIVTAEQFVDWIFEAEGWKSERFAKDRDNSRESLIDSFVSYMGGESVDARMLKYSFDDDAEDD